MGFLPSRQLILSLLWLLVCARLQTPISAARKSYVVYMGSHQQSRNWVSSDHHEFLRNFVGSQEKGRESIFYSYTKHINGFAAHLEEDEVAEISKSPMVVAVFPNEKYELHTTRSWEFLGLEKDGSVPADSIWRKARLGQEIIVGNLDTGVWPESESFNDEGLGPVPARWKGACESSASDPIRCNRKLIGARFYNKGFLASGGTLKPGENTSRDLDGHGTHTLATAAGRPVPGASLFGFANGTAKGGAPSARVAAYKVCWGAGENHGCLSSDILAAFDQAIEDGVDVLSASVGGRASDYFADGIAVGAFHAMTRGIPVVCSAGNSGPRLASVGNVAPWIFTVGASTMDREFTSYAILGNGIQLKGQSLSTSSLPANVSYPLITGADAQAANSTLEEALICSLGSLDPVKVKGKIVACPQGNVSDVEKGQAALLAGGVGVITLNNPASGNDVSADPHILPAVGLSYTDGIILLEYIRSSTNPIASITAPVTVVGTKPAPFMASFSSRGPNPINPVILKPDITAPGARVLAAYSEAVDPSGEPFDIRRVKFNIISGTSMSCPHVAGIVALLKSIHPDWSPAAIRSAIMTTATTEDSEANSILGSSFNAATPFSYGAGHVRPNLAADPGLVYDLAAEDYISFLCAAGYNSSMLLSFSGDAAACPQSPPRLLDFNYPSITVPRLFSPETVSRKLKNVGPPGTYTVQVTPPGNVSVVVTPETLVFSSLGQEEAFSVTLNAEAGARVGVFGSLTWSDGVHTVRSPIVVDFLRRAR